jgi:hypothetical protein
MINPILGYEGLYSVTDGGRVLNLTTGRELRGTVYSHGYRMICLCRMGIVERRSLHKIVAEAFIGPRPVGMQIDHIDGDKSNNRASNLRYCLPKDNIANAVRHGQMPSGERNGQAKLTSEQIGAILKAKASGRRYWGSRELATKFGVHDAQIRRVARGVTYRECAAAIRALKERT